MIKGVIFDVGGVLAYDVWEHLLCDPPGNPMSISAKYGIPVADMERIGADLWRHFDRRKGDPDSLEQDYWQEVLQRVPQLSSVPLADCLSVTDEFIRPVDGMETVALLEWLLHKGIYLGICSNNNEFWALRQIRKLDLYRYFFPSAVILSCHHGITKSDPGLFHIAADALRLHPRECAFVDDRMGNVSRAVDCGMTGVFFPTEQSPAKPQRGARYLRRLLDGVLV